MRRCVLFLLVAGVIASCSSDESEGSSASPGTQAVATSTQPEQESSTAPTPSLPSTVLPTPESWSPILSTTRAKTAPPAATCPAGADPSSAGLVTQQRPLPGWVGNLAAAFDQHAGGIVYVNQQGETWILDVCANLWHQMNPTGSPADQGDLFDSAGEPSGVLGPLVYDVDSDVTVALNREYVAVYDANSNTWTRHSGHGSSYGFGFGGAVYDPVSGLVLTTNMLADDPPGPVQRWELLAYDVDTNTWSTVGTIPGNLEQLDFLGYSQAIDRFITVGFHFGEAFNWLVDPHTAEAVTGLVDPRTGETTLISTETPIVDLAWPSAVYGPAGDTVYVSGHLDPRTMCGFDTNSLTWECTESPEFPRPNYYRFAAAVGDPINDRLVLINVVYGDWLRSSTDDLWAIDLDTDEWSQLLAPSRSSEDVFSFAEDDLCDWVSEDEVTSILRVAFAQSGIEWDGKAVASVAEGTGWFSEGVPTFCKWEVPVADEFYVDAPTEFFNATGEFYVVATALTPSHFAPIEEFDGETWVAASGHPDFADGVIAASAAFGRYGFWLDGSEEVLGLEVYLGDLDEYEKALFVVANGFLDEMNWAP